MADDLAQLVDWIQPLLAGIDSKQRRVLARKLAVGLRQRQQQRIKQQKNPDGSDYEKRKFRRGRRIQKGAMFQKLRLAKYLRVRGTEDAASVYFLKKVAHIAKVHQYGEHDRPSPKSRSVRYRQRELLGFTTDDITYIRDSLIDHLSP